MPNTELTGLAQTVLGPVQPEALGPTLPHEHLLIDFSFMLIPPVKVTDIQRAHEPVSLENLGWIRYNWFSNLDNLLILDEEEAIAEAELYKRAGGGTIVDVTNIGIGRDPLALARISRATGLNVVMGAGYYVGSRHPDDMDDRTESELAAQIVNEVVTGVDDTGVKAGIIGEIGCSWPLTQNERKVLRAAAAAQRETGASILVHPGRDETAPREIIEVLAEAGADLSRTIMGHLDRTVSEMDTLIELAQSGCYLEYDLFGHESSYYPLADITMPSDSQRLDFIQKLAEAGYLERVFMSHDVCTKHRLVNYGGHGYAHILEHIVPRMRRRGFSDQDIQTITVANPTRLLTFV